MSLRDQIQFIQKQTNLKYQNLNIIVEIKACTEQVWTRKKYRNIIAVIIMAISLFSTMPITSSHYLYLNPVFDCQGRDYKVNEDQACKMIDFCTIINSQTITSVLKLYCSKKTDRIFIQSTSGFGTWVGIALSGLISDKKGRKFSLIVGLLIINVSWMCQIGGIYFHNYEVLVVSQFLLGISTKLISVNCLILLLRFLNKDQYQICTIGWFVLSSGIAPIFIAAINIYLQEFKYLVAANSIGNTLCLILALIFLHEDPVFCIGAGNIKKCKQIILEVALLNEQSEERMNNAIKVIDLLYEYQIRRFERNDSLRIKSKVNFKDILQFKIIIKVAILGILLCFTSVATLSIGLSIQTLKTSYDFNLILLGVSVCLSYFIFLSIQKIQHNYKRGFLFSSAIYAIMASLFAFKFTIENSEIQMVALFFTNFFLCWTHGFIVRLKVKVFPEKYQGILLGAVEVLSNFGKVVSPTLIQKSNELGLNPIFGLNLIRMTIGTFPILLMNTNKIQIEEQKQQSLPTHIK